MEWMDGADGAIIPTVRINTEYFFRRQCLVFFSSSSFPVVLDRDDAECNVAIQSKKKKSIHPSIRRRNFPSALPSLTFSTVVLIAALPIGSFSLSSLYTALPVTSN